MHRPKILKKQNNIKKKKKFEKLSKDIIKNLDKLIKGNYSNNQYKYINKNLYYKIDKKIKNTPENIAEDIKKDFIDLFILIINEKNKDN